MKPYRILLLIVVALAALVVLAACSQTPPAETVVPTIDLQSTATVETAAGDLAVTPTGYPAPAESMPTAAQPTGYPGDTVPNVEQPAAGAATAYPAESGPQGVPAVENRSRVTARLIEQAPANTPDQTRLRVEVLTSTDIEGMQNFTRDKVNQQIDFVIDTAKLPAGLAVGETFEAEVSYRGDERGGLYLVETLTETAQ